MAITLINTVTVGAGGAASIDFNSIPGTFTDLLLVVSNRNSTAAVDDATFLRINGSTSGYSTRDLYGNGSTGASSTNPYGTTAYTYLGATPAANATSNAFANKAVYFANYAGSTAKSISTDSVMENNGSLSYQECLAGLWTGTAAITSLSLTPSTGTFVQFSSATLYGITKGSSGGVTVS